MRNRLIPASALCCIAAVAAAAFGGGGNPSPPIIPDPRLTPGDVLPVTAKDVCVAGYTKKVRNVPEAVKMQVFRAYGIDPKTINTREWEIDHTQSLELGGSNSTKNLFPEKYDINWNGYQVGAHTKDHLENVLHALVCSGKISLAEAQEAIRTNPVTKTNWITAYRKYIGELPKWKPPTHKGG